MENERNQSDLFNFSKENLKSLKNKELDLILIISRGLLHSIAIGRDLHYIEKRATEVKDMVIHLKWENKIHH